MKNLYSELNQKYYFYIFTKQYFVFTNKYILMKDLHF